MYVALTSDGTPANQETTVETSKKKKRKKKRKRKRKKNNNNKSVGEIISSTVCSWALCRLKTELSEWWRCRHTHTQCCFQLGLSASGFRCYCSIVCLPLRWTHIGTQPPRPGMATLKATVAAVIISFFRYFFSFFFFRSSY
jgi:hypothetical protein